ncbi:class I SAM-dependent methyltransferase [Roseateles sp. DB2]|uniref:class I SAM-dependent methyltransferase n=1 Tax=Roseateles sp. DB2 TaxID=3453717 RepID=UPI003EEBC0B3
MDAVLSSPVDRAAAQRAIEHHYDVGNAFYALWLDAGMSYSCALWPEHQHDADLESAQQRKLDYHLAESRALDASRVLDIGCGWGSLLHRLQARSEQLTHATGLTLSAEQASHVRSLGLPGVEVRLENWLDHTPDQPYGAMISIGAFEHFATPDDTVAEKRAKYRRFFEFARDHLQRRGRLSLQTIAYLNLDRSQASEFMEQQIFPNADLPTLPDIVEAASGVMEIVRVRNDRLDYARTCELWAHRLKARRAEAIALVGLDTVKRYERYLQLSSLGFFMGKICLLRLTLQRH